MLAEIASRGCERFVAELDQSAAKSTDQTPEGKLHAMSRGYLRFAGDNAAVYSLMFGSKGACAMTPHLAKASFAAWDQLELAVTLIVGKARAVDGALLVWSTVHGLAMLRQEQRIPPHLAPHAALEVSLRMMIAGLSAERR